MIKPNKPIKWIVLLLAIIVIGIAALIFLNPDTKHEEFQTYSELKKSMLIEKGWVPEFVPESSRNIEVVYNIDTNFVSIALLLEGSEINIYVNRLKADGWHVTQNENSIEANKQQ